ncbi:MAG: WYL domain-containing protein [Acidimicrobiales bacterium]
MAEIKGNMRWGVERRLEFIEFRLFWEGHINRSDLIGTFGVSVQQASADIKRYLDMASANMAYDKSAKAYVRAPGFKARFLEPEAGRYLSQIKSVADEIVGMSETWIGQFPPFDTTPTPARSVNAIVLRTIIAAIRGSEAVEINYQSLSRPEPRWRWIAPHAIGFDGFRWHARAFCEIGETFKDFLLSRILETRATRPSDSDPKTDAAWHEHVTLEIGPHPELSYTQKKVIALDYGMRGSCTKISVRRAFLYYALKRLGLDTDPTARRPQDQQIVLLNREAPELLTMLHREDA